MSAVEYQCVGSSSVGGFKVTMWSPRAPVALWLDGQTAAGRTVSIMGDPCSDERAEVWIDGERARDLRVRRWRDGGSTAIVTNRGRIYRPTPFRPTAVSMLDGEPLEPRVEPVQDAYPSACPHCRGTGGGTYNDCAKCDGNGVV